MAGSKGIVSAQFYTFSAANRTITFTNDYAGLDLGEITYITNIKNGVATVIYDPFDSTKGGTLSGLTLTLAYNTTAMADTDPLQIITGFTPLNADPQPVRIVEGPDQVDDTALLQNISDNLDFLNLSLDQSEGIQMNVREVNPIKKDVDNALVLSDNIEVKWSIPGSTSATSPVIDTKGYSLITWNLLGSWSANSAQFSSDGANWFTIPTYYSVGGAMWLRLAGGSIGTSGNTIFAAPVVARYFRVSLSNNSAAPLQITFTLKPQFFIPYVATDTSITTIGNAVLNATDGSLSTQGNAGISALQPTAPTTNPPNANSTLSTTVPFPFGVAGREWPYIGALSGVFRYINVDARGNLQIGGDTAFRTPNMGGRIEQSQAGTTRGIGGIFNNIQGAQSLTVSDTNQSEGDTDNMLLKQILQELKILNQQLTEIPFLMNAGQSQMSDPQEYRNDNSTLF